MRWDLLGMAAAGLVAAFYISYLLHVGVIVR